MTLLDKTAAIIVTFNRADKLVKVIESLQRQTRRPDIIFVVDNASTDDTQDIVVTRAQEDLSIRYLRLPNNVGGAGGFHAGLKAAYEDGANYFWISDDDAYPEPDAIEKLLSALRQFEAETQWRPSFAASRVEWIDGSLCEMNTPRPVWDWPRFVRPDKAWALIDSASFVSILVPRWAVEAHGLPIADYFIWFDDAEYTRRLSRSYPGIFVPESRVSHDTPDNRGVNFGFVSEKNLWKFRYGARNEASWRRREFGLTGVLSYVLGVHRQMKAGNVPLKLRRKIYASILNGVRFFPTIKTV